MSENKPNEYWLQKMKLWVILHGGMDEKNHQRKVLCKYCIYEGGRDCKLVKPAGEGAWPVITKNRLMVSKDLKAIRDCREFYNLDWRCIEFIKHV